MIAEQPKPKSIFLADDDSDDCILFEDALREICDKSSLSIANDGEQLMKLLSQSSYEKLPDTIFLDVNMPCKNGFECLEEIKREAGLQHIPVIMFSTTSHDQSVKQAYELGADLYIQKPSSFTALKDVIKKILSLSWEQGQPKVPLTEFVLKMEGN